MTHAELVERAVKWLRNEFRCRVVLSELVALTRAGETPDAIGWVFNRAILVECKRTRSDFYADRKKMARLPHMPALGAWRFYLTPPDILRTSQIPMGWGLYEVQGKKIVHVQGEKYANAKAAPLASDRDSEVALLVSALARRQP